MKWMLWLGVLTAQFVPMCALAEDSSESPSYGRGDDWFEPSYDQGAVLTSKDGWAAASTPSASWRDAPVYRPYDPGATQTSDDRPAQWVSGAVYRDQVSGRGGIDRGMETYRFRDGATWPPTPYTSLYDSRNGVADNHDYRFRDDSPASSGRESVSGYEPTYRFRPLTEREKARVERDVQWRTRMPPEAEGRRPGLLDDAMAPPGESYGFEPNPWVWR